jgi:hypothetical protein
VAEVDVRAVEREVLAELPGGLMTTAEAAEALGVSPRYLEDLRYRGCGPRFVRHGPRCIRYRPRELARWIAARTVTSTSDPGPETDSREAA